MVGNLSYLPPLGTCAMYFHVLMHLLHSTQVTEQEKFKGKNYL